MIIVDKKNEFIENHDDIICVTRNDIEILKSKAMKNSRHRIRQNLHQSMNDQVHEMIIVHTVDTYVRPHRHTTKSESFHLIEGNFTVIIFDDEGQIIRKIPMSATDSSRSFCYRIAPGIWHTLVAESEFIVFHETTAGPFAPNQAEFAPWSPQEGEEAVNPYLDSLRNSLKT